MTDKGSGRAQDILDSAKDVLVESGFSGLSYRAIAKRAGITIGNISYYYGSKDDLLVALAEYLFDRWELRFQRKVEASAMNPAGVLRYAVRYMIEENKREKSCSLLMDMWAMANHNPGVAAMTNAFYQRMQDHIGRMLLEVNPSLSEQQWRLRAGLITTQIEGLMVLLAPNRPRAAHLAGLEELAIAQIEQLATAA